MTALASMRKLLFGDSWSLPVSVVAIVALALGIRELAPAFWGDIGGLAVLAATAVALLVTTLCRM